MKKIAILGATGSIGTSVLSVVRDHPGQFMVTGLAARRAGREMSALAAEFPEAALATEEAPETACADWLVGAGAATELARTVDADLCVLAISGTAGLAAAFAAAERGLTILLANKEVLVSAGDLFMAIAAERGARVLPIDSEHAALWQCMEGRDRSRVARATITASGGPFRQWERERMVRATPAEALRHPKWNMGAKISIDSATLANKALEVIEARALFGFSEVGVLVHPQSVVHGMIEWADGSLIAHMGVCDMRQPIQYMLNYPEGARWRGERVDLARAARLDFHEPDRDRFPLLGLGLEAGERGGLAPAYFNAANEEAVHLFLSGGIGFMDMAGIVEQVLSAVPEGKAGGLADVLEAHSRARALALEAAASCKPIGK